MPMIITSDMYDGNVYHLEIGSTSQEVVSASICV